MLTKDKKIVLKKLLKNIWEIEHKIEIFWFENKVVINIVEPQTLKGDFCDLHIALENALMTTEWMITKFKTDWAVELTFTIERMRTFERET